MFLISTLVFRINFVTFFSGLLNDLKKKNNVSKPPELSTIQPRDSERYHHNSYLYQNGENTLKRDNVLPIFAPCGNPYVNFIENPPIRS